MRSKRTRWTLAAAATLTFAGAAIAEDDAATFVTEAVQGNVAEIKMGELAQQRGKSSDVRDFGQTLVTDHGKGLEKSSALAKTLGVNAPKEPSAEAKMHYDALSKLSGEEFDREFAAHMALAHQKNIAKYRQVSATGDSQVAAFAKETLPTLEKHFATAQAIEKDAASDR